MDSLNIKRAKMVLITDEFDRDTKNKIRDYEKLLPFRNRYIESPKVNPEIEDKMIDEPYYYPMYFTIVEPNKTDTFSFEYYQLDSIMQQIIKIGK